MAQTRFYSSTAVATELQVGVDSVATELVFQDITGWPASLPFTVILDEDQVWEEIVTCLVSNGATGFTVQRGVDGTEAQTHASGASAHHGFSAQDFRESSQHVGSTLDVHGVGGVVGLTEEQELSNKTLLLPYTLEGVEGDVVGTEGEQVLSSKTLLEPTIQGEIFLDQPTINNPVLDSPVISDFSEAVHDHSSAQGGGQVPISTGIGGITGMVIQFAGSGSLEGFVECNGVAVGRTDPLFASLFDVIGTIWGEGDGQSSFNLPDLRDKVPVGAGAKALAQEGGSWDQTLTEGNLPSHSHTGPNHSHTLPGHNHTAYGSSGSSKIASGQMSKNSGTGDGAQAVTRGEDSGPGREWKGSGHNHSISVGVNPAPAMNVTANGTGPTGVTGSGQPFRVEPPYVAVRWMIKLGPNTGTL
jgi:microcystin-dependent protein